MLTAEPTVTERIKQLALTCELDRLRLRIALKPAPPHEMTLGGLPASAIGKALSFTQYFPGKIGQVARGVSLGSAVFRIVQPFFLLRSRLNKIDPGTNHEGTAKSSQPGSR